MLASVEAIMTDILLNNEVLLTVNDLVVEFPLGRRSKIHAVSGVSFHIDRSETLGLVGESGCGKSTLARTIVRLETPTKGDIRFDNEDLTHYKSKRWRKLRPGLQMIFQDAVASLNPGRSIGETIAEPLRVIGKIGRKARFGRARELMRLVGLDPDRDFVKLPHEFSGGQCQRISIARSLIMNPKLLVCDEPVSSWMCRCKPRFSTCWSA
jgi:peptide/nickel transport system ATP-binding protein